MHHFVNEGAIHTTTFYIHLAYRGRGPRLLLGLGKIISYTKDSAIRTYYMYHAGTTIGACCSLQQESKWGMWNLLLAGLLEHQAEGF